MGGAITPGLQAGRYQPNTPLLPECGMCYIGGRRREHPTPPPLPHRFPQITGVLPCHASPPLLMRGTEREGERRKTLGRCKSRDTEICAGAGAETYENCYSKSVK